MDHQLREDEEQSSPPQRASSADSAAVQAIGVEAGGEEPDTLLRPGENDLTCNIL